MPLPLRITLRDIPPSEPLEAHIRDTAQKLEQRNRRITSCHVTVDETALHHQRGRQFEVQVEVRAPGREAVSTRAHNEDAYVAVRDAFRAARRQLETQVRRRGPGRRVSARRGPASSSA